ncbi:DegV family protein [Spongiactinospora sp. TRM90649]|uniref:DegV family protein n=1 Tax=Spongiactinospora sp. TRM90649 TaxID=3031114 RepID=UPI0023F93BD5|nr:DegV family protein [Spongiactinospora sp. TRM90649]MDF5754089.1 DegV family protein [Spongiactinospora sp. TRM90649]
MPPPPTAPSTAVVTDSTAYLSPAEIARLGVVVVPLQVIAGDRALDDDPREIRAAGLSDALAGRTGVTTSRPSPERFAEAYAALAARGVTGAVSVHVSGEMSGTAGSARLAARDAPIPVEVIDSRSIAMGLGFPVLAAAEAALAGGVREEVTAAARRHMDTARTYFYLDTLETLRRGGRVGVAAGLVGSALRVKPLLHITGGSIVPLEKVRTSSRALARLEDLAAQACGEKPTAVAVQYLGDQAKAADLAERLRRRVTALARLEVVEMGAVIGAHVGPGMLGVTVTPWP